MLYVKEIKKCLEDENYTAIIFSNGLVRIVSNAYLPIALNAINNGKVF